jgi:hypothetical protein
MKRNQTNRGATRRLMYVENKSGEIDGHRARIGWVTFSKSGLSIYYRGRSFARLKGQGVAGNYLDTETHEEYWISGLKRRGSNVHPNERRFVVHVDEDAREDYERSASA